jgi:hypothetical protein
VSATLSASARSAGMLMWMRLVHGLMTGKFCGLREWTDVSIYMTLADWQRFCLAGS